MKGGIKEIKKEYMEDELHDFFKRKNWDGDSGICKGGSDRTGYPYIILVH